MTSEERHAARRERRELKRQQKKQEAMKEYDSFENVISCKSLKKAANKARKGVFWKASTQKYFMSFLRNIFKTHKKLLDKISPVLGFIIFWLYERGKKRMIRSVHFEERVVQRSACANALIPAMTRSLVPENGASMEGRGIHFQIFKCCQQLHDFYRKHGTNGYILLVDFSGYFDNIQHEPIRAMLDAAFADDDLKWLIWEFVTSFGEESLGIGSEVSQILAVAYHNPIDHYAREVLGLNLSGCYMDDSYYMHESKEYLQECYEKLKIQYAKYGIKVNERKTQIIPIRRFTFLKIRFMLTDTGKVVLKPNKNAFTILRQKLKKFKGFQESGEMTMGQIRTSYESTYGYHRHFDAHKSLREMDKLFFRLFGVFPKHKKRRKKPKKYWRDC